MSACVHIRLCADAIFANWRTGDMASVYHAAFHSASLINTQFIDTVAASGHGAIKSHYGTPVRLENVTFSGAFLLSSDPFVR
jgi:hypothetical protein